MFAWPGSPPLFDGLELDVPDGEITAVVGASGCGKSTLLRLLAGLLEPRAGRVLGRPPSLSFVFQDPTLLPWLDLARNVALPLELAGASGTAGAVARALDRVGLGDAAHRLPHELSGGMRMRAALARALVTTPGLVLLDEPFSSVDALTRRRLHAGFLSLWREVGFTVLLVTHDLDEAVLLAGRVLVLGGRPARVVQRVDVDLRRPRALGMVHQSAFGACVARIERSLVPEGATP